MDAACITHSGEPPQAIAADDRLWLEAFLGPLGDCLRCEAIDHVEFQMNRLAGIIDRDGSHEGRLVLRTATDLAARALALDAGIVKLHSPFKQSSGLLPGHGVVDLVVKQPGRGVAHAQIALHGQRRDPSLGLADQVDGKEPCRQGKLGVLHQGAGRQRCLMATVTALVQLAAALSHQIVLRTVALRAPKTLWPTRALNRLCALRLSAKAAQELGDRHALLEPDLVTGHRSAPC